MKPFNTPWRELKNKNHYLVHVSRDLIMALNNLDWYTGFRVVCHMLYDDDRGPLNVHKRGLAADLHIEGSNVLDQFLFVQRLNIFTGIGIYGPDVWRNPGLHLDIREADQGARWAFRHKDPPHFNPARRVTPDKAERVQVPIDREYIKYLLEIM